MKSHAAFGLLAFAGLLSAVSAQTYVDLDFSNNIQAATHEYPNNSTLGPLYHPGPYLQFANAGSYNGVSIDVQATMIGLTNGETSNFRETSTYEWVGWIPSYNDEKSNNDLGVYYRHDGNPNQPTGGIAWTLSFYVGGSNFTESIELPGVRLLIYDHDGEPLQSESIRAFTGDGFAGYQLHNDSGIHVHDEGDSFRFDSRGWGHSETSAEGGMILYYHNTSSIRFDMFGTTHPHLPAYSSGIFAAWDGDLGVNGGGTDNFGDYMQVPEPSSTLLVGIGGIGVLLRRSRSQSA